VRVEGEGFVDAEPLHHGEGRAIDETEGLVGHCLDDVPRRLEIDGVECHDGRARVTTAYEAPVSTIMFEAVKKRIDWKAKH